MTVTRGILCGLAVLALGASPVQGQTTQISTEYLMTLYAPLDPVQEVDSSLAVYNLRREVLTSKDLYFITAPTLQTSSKKYAWVNHVQCVGKVVELKDGENSFVKYDIFIVR